GDGRGAIALNSPHISSTLLPRGAAPGCPSIVLLPRAHPPRGTAHVGRCAYAPVLGRARRGGFMATFSRSDDLQNAVFRGVNLSGARFAESDLSNVVMRGVDIAGSDIDAPWLSEAGSVLRVNGIDVAPFVEAELNQRFPGRAERRAADPDGLLAA